MVFWKRWVVGILENRVILMNIDNVNVLPFYLIIRESSQCSLHSKILMKIKPLLMILGIVVWKGSLFFLKGSLCNLGCLELVDILLLRLLLQWNLCEIPEFTSYCAHLSLTFIKCPGSHNKNLESNIQSMANRFLFPKESKVMGYGWWK